MQEEPEEIIELNNDLERNIAEVFHVFDIGANHTCDTKEVGNIARALGCCPTEAEVLALVHQVEEHNAPGTVKLQKFIPYISADITEHKYAPASPEEILAAFHLLDPEGRGYITKEAMTTFMTQDGEPFTQDELEEMLELAVDPHTKNIPYEYFVNQLMYEPDPEHDNYHIADEIRKAKVPSTIHKRFSEMMAEMAMAAHDEP